MKKRIWKTFATGMQCTLAALAMTTIVACDKDDGNIDSGWIVDFSPIAIYIEPVDASGNNLMAEMKDKKITAEWRGVVFEKDSLERGEVPQTRYYMPTFRGIATHPNGKVLVFGELAGEQTFENEQILLNWGDGDCDTIVFSHKLKGNHPKNYEYEEKITLNGVLQESFHLKIVK